MKKTICIAAVILLVSSLWAYDFDSSSRRLSMGGTGNADYVSEINFFANPAAVAFYSSDYTLSVSAGAMDYFLAHNGNLFPNNPDSFYKVQFVGYNISFGIGVDFDLENIVPVEGITYYDGIEEFEASINVATSIGPVAGGLGIDISSCWKRVNVPISNQRAFADMIREFYLSPYFRVNDSASINLDAGFIYSGRFLDLGVKFDSIVSYGESSVVFDWTTFINGISLSATYNPQIYTKRGRLKPLVYSVSVEAANFLDKKNRTLKAGTEILFQLARNHSLAMRLGYISPADIFPNGNITAGLGYRLHNVDVGLYTSIPMDVFYGASENYSVGLSVTSLF